DKSHVYNSVEFSELNRGKADSLHYLVFADTKTRGGMILGRRGDVMCTPFSAPYGGIVAPRRLKTETVDLIWVSAADFARHAECSLRVTLPPTFVDPDLIAKSVNALTQLGATALADINHHVDLARAGSPAALFAMKSRNQLNQAQKLPYSFEKLDPTPANINRVYDVIVANHESRGFPVNMRLDDVVATAPIVGAEFFILTLDGIDVGAAQVHHPVAGMAQVIYWGDRPGFAPGRPMNMLAFKLFDYYMTRGAQIVDIGISTERGVPNYGLCDFKEGVGCSPTVRWTFMML
ncbi:MAG: hypothetical protein K2O10_03650, partial [Muribaculaceae bacterium]|nr:hypothetical protein [Muribaculaceae bacterium]